MRYKKHALRVRFWFFKNILRSRIPNHDLDHLSGGFPANVWNVCGNVLFLLTMAVFFKRDRFRRYFFRIVPSWIIRKYVRTVFLMIAHDGRTSFLAKYLLNRDPAMNCDA